MKKLSLLICLLVFSTITFQCRKEAAHTWADPNPGESPYDIERGANVNTDILGIVKDEMGVPVSGAEIKIGNLTMHTNEFGLFTAKQVQVNENHGFVLAKKAGFFNGSRTFIPMQGGNTVIIRMLRQDIAVDFPASTGGTIKTGNVQIDLGAGFVDESGSAYTGNVNMTAKFLDPESDLLHEIMPGDLRGADEEGEKVLESFGMVAVELHGSGGQKLQPSSNNPATLKMELSPTLAAIAKPTIPLWHFDEKKGIWIHEGEAVLENGAYVGKVSHFSFWNCDAPFKVARIDGLLLDQFGDAVPNVSVSLKPSSGSKRYGRANWEGRFGGLIPVDEVLEIEVVSDKKKVLYSGKIGPFSTNAVVPTIEIQAPFTSYKGNIRNCDGTTPQSTYLVIDGKYVVQAKDGNFDFRLNYDMDAPGSYRAVAVSSEGKYSPEFDLVNDGKVYDVGSFVLCNGVAFKGKWKISYTAGGKQFDIPQPTVYSYVPGYLNFSGGAAVDSMPGHAFVLALEFPMAPDNKQVLTPDTKGFIRLSTDISPLGFVTADQITVEVQKVLINGKEELRVIFDGFVKEYDPNTSSFVYTKIESGIIEQE